MKKISLILTYFNEEESIKNTFSMIIKQSMLPDEVIFINSNSNDNTSNILDQLISSHKNININFKNVYSNTKFPSDSANLGIQLSNNSLIAFMDCGLIFHENWLKNQYNLLISKQLDAILGSCILYGSTLVDKCCVAQTYGYGKERACIPGSIIKKNVFINIGFFEERRACFDVIWKNKLKKSKIPFDVNFIDNVLYDGHNYSSSFFRAMKKNFEYICFSNDTRPYIASYFYFFVSLVALTIISLDLTNIIYLISVYLMYRLIIPFIKSSKFSFIKKNIFSFPFLIISGIFIDFGKFAGSIVSIINFIKLRRIIITALTILVVVFYSPLYWFMGKYLIINDKITNADAIVVFSGHGETTYINASYQKRTLEAINFYKEGLSDKIIISSGREQTIAEVKIIKSLLIEYGVDEKNIIIIDEYPSSTYENVIMVNEILKKLNYSKIILVTSPYHQKRSLLLWNKNAPNIMVQNYKSIDAPSDEIEWISSYKKVRVITYEYFSILYNYFYNRL